MRYTCPICGYPELKEDPEDMGHEICHTCGFEFGWSDMDQGYSYEQWREKWITEGMRWCSRGLPKPKNWNPRAQLRNIGIVIE